MERSENTSTFTSTDGLKIFYRTHISEADVARLVIVHGIGEHSGRYGNVIDTLLDEGISVLALDLRGHGHSEGKRGHVGSFDEYVSDVLSLVNIAKEDKKESTRLFLLGHSMGGLIVIYFALKYPEMIDGLIVSSPALGLAVKVPTIKRILGNLMSRVFPSLTMANGLDVSMLSHDEQVVKAYIEDPLVHDRVSARWFTELLSALETVNSSAKDLKIPILMQLAGDDYLTDANAARQFFENLTVQDKTLHVYEGAYHEIYNEKKGLRHRALQELLTWIETRR